MTSFRYKKIEEELDELYLRCIIHGSPTLDPSSAGTYGLLQTASHKERDLKICELELELRTLKCTPRADRSEATSLSHEMRHIGRTFTPKGPVPSASKWTTTHRSDPPSVYTPASHPHCSATKKGPPSIKGEHERGKRYP